MRTALGRPTSSPSLLRAFQRPARAAGIPCAQACASRHGAAGPATPAARPRSVPGCHACCSAAQAGRPRRSAVGLPVALWPRSHSGPACPPVRAACYLAALLLCLGSVLGGANVGRCAPGALAGLQGALRRAGTPAALAASPDKGAGLSGAGRGSLRRAGRAILPGPNQLALVAGPRLRRRRRRGKRVPAGAVALPDVHAHAGAAPAAQPRRAGAGSGTVQQAAWPGLSLGPYATL